MKHPLTLALSVIACFFFAIACERNINSDLPPGPGPVEPGKIITTSFVGRVLDETESPVKNAVVKAGEKTATTDDNGIFRITNVNIPEQYAYLKVEKPGYFNGSRTIIANPYTANFVEVQLIEKKLSGTFNAASDAEIILQGGAAIKFSANCISAKDGAAYTGNVNVHAAVIDPSAPNFSRIMPGDLRGIRTDSSIAAMISYGMITVLLTGNDGQELQLRQGKTAEISMPVSPSLQASAPAEIPLWHFDETSGKWREEGKALRHGNIYSGEVAHFSTWNYDVPTDFVVASLQVSGPKARTMPYTAVKITDMRNGSHMVTYTDSLGRLETWVPKNAQLKIEVLNRCNKVLATTNAGPFDADVTIDPIVVAENNDVIVVRGLAIDCQGQLLKTGHVKLFAGGLYYTADVANGSFNIIINDCSEREVDAELYAYDNETSQTGLTVTVRLDGKQIDAGELRACGKQLTEFAILKIGDRRFQLEAPPDRIDFRRFSDSTYIWFGLAYAYSTTQISIGMFDTIPHFFESPSVVMSAADTFYSASGPIKYNITKYGKVNEYIEMNFSGTVINDTSAIAYPFAGEMRVRRRF